jgi:hypothetical protein
MLLGGAKGDRQREEPGGVDIEPADHALGRSRGGLSCKLHLAVEGGQRPLSIVVTAGQRGDSPQFGVVLASPASRRFAPARAGALPWRLPTAPPDLRRAHAVDDSLPICRCSDRGSYRRIVPLNICTSHPALRERNDV